MINDGGVMREIGLTTVKNLDGDVSYGGIYGMEVIIDCYECDAKLFHRKHIRRYFKGLVELLEMQAGPRHFKQEAEGLTAIQFILTSNITIHCLDILERVYVNIFSCKEFSDYKATQYTQDFFKANRIGSKTVMRV